jgi:alkylation response protein AidB-like acyl-CoA dehydrogenase
MPFEQSTIGLGMVAPALIAHRSIAQQQGHLRRIFTGEEIWCQLFSEPAAGSDIASLATSARLENGE